MNMEKGLVTFADILGWKGIWKNTKENDNPSEKLLNTKKAIDLEIVKNYIKIFDNELIDRYELINIESIDPERKIGKMIDKKEIKEYIKEQLAIYLRTKEKDKEKVRKELLEFSNLIVRAEISIEVDLISDTFVITSYSINENKENELEEHLKIVQKLIIKCLDKGLLIRGATSYGKYQKEELVFVGPAIDEAASWHEQGEEIGVFLTPSAIFNFEGFENDELVRKRTPKLKGTSFETLCVNWKEGKKLFEKIYKNESPIIPEIAKKYINTKKLLKGFESLTEKDEQIIKMLKDNMNDTKIIEYTNISNKRLEKLKQDYKIVGS